jgi:hypothetical protein
MDTAPIPAAPPTAQPRAEAASSVDAEASKGMRMAQAKAIVCGITGFHLFHTRVSGTDGCLRRQAERKVRRRKGAAGGKKAATAGNGKGQVVRSSAQC